MESSNIYKTPKSDLSNSKRKITFTQKLLISFPFHLIFWVLMLNYLIWLREEYSNYTLNIGWLTILVLSIVFALNSALISGFFPSQKKYFYTPAGLVIFTLILLTVFIVAAIYK